MSSAAAPMLLIVAHHHFRPGGVRRVIELALPGLARGIGPELRALLLVGGEAPPAAWLRDLEATLPAGCPTPEVRTHPSLAYAAEQGAPPAGIATGARAFLRRLLAPVPRGQALVWLHNPGLGRNLPAIDAWRRTCAQHRIPVVFHHHDWWFDNRWQRWPELRAASRGSLARIARTLLPSSPLVRHAAINRADARPLRRAFGGQAMWIPNPVSPLPPPNASRMAAARRWLHDRTGTRGPVWLLPCRLLRRKNIAEALLLTRWLAPEARLATTAGVSSADEAPYAEALRAAATRHRWPLDLSVLVDAPVGAPTVSDLLSISEGAMLTSLAEGFGLPYLEAAAAGRPLVARRLANIAPDLSHLGFHFPNLYRDILIDPGLFDTASELRRQSERFAAWIRGMPPGLRRRVPTPKFLLRPRAPVAFSRLTLLAQFEVLSVPPDESLRLAVRDNPWLAGWMRPKRGARLSAPAWPEAATRRLSGEAYARSLLRLARAPASPHTTPSGSASLHAQEELLNHRLRPEQLHPLLWTTTP